jgi:hypothetical protein
MHKDVASDSIENDSCAKGLWSAAGMILALSFNMNRENLDIE